MLTVVSLAQVVPVRPLEHLLAEANGINLRGLNGIDLHKTWIYLVDISSAFTHSARFNLFTIQA